MPYKDKLKQNAYINERTKARRLAWLAGKVCVWCGSADRLTIDHIDRQLKVSHRIWNWSAERFNTEIVKCQVLCTPCHELKTAKENRLVWLLKPWPPHGTRARYDCNFANCRCALCVKAHYIAIQEYRKGKSKLVSAAMV